MYRKGEMSDYSRVLSCESYRLGTKLLNAFVSELVERANANEHNLWCH